MRLRLAILLLAACATTGAEGEGDVNLPSAGVGPFRKLDIDEVKGIAPFVLDDSFALYREPAVLRDGTATLLYAVARRDDKDVIVRTRALDERTFFGDVGDLGRKPAVVLEADAPWEVTIGGPAVVRWRGEILLYYSGAAGVGMARSADGLAFRKEAGPVLSGGRAPSVFELPNGRLRMFYAAGNAIAEAESDDGVFWRRRGDVLFPAPPQQFLLPNEKPPFDTAAVGDPCAVTRMTPAGRFHVRVLYTGTDGAGATAIGLAGRYGEDGPLVRQPVPAYSVGQREAAPALLDLGDRSFLYVHQDRPDGNDPPYAAIAGAFAPGNVLLPPPGDYPDQP